MADASLDRILAQYARPQSAIFGWGAMAGDEYPGPRQPIDLRSDYLLADRSAVPALGDGSVLTEAYDRVLPSHAFWDKYVTDDPSFHDRVGRIQSAGLGAVNALGFGLPMALAHRVAPDRAVRIQAVLDAYSNEKIGGTIAGAVANPANVGLRAAGNALASRGWGIGPQAAADGLTALGVYSMPEIVRHGGVTGLNDLPATTAMVSRVMMPTLPPSIVERTWRGAQAGAMGQLPEMVMLNDVTRPAIGAIYGAGYGAGLKPRGRDALKADKLGEKDVREAYFSNLLPGLTVAGGLKMAPWLSRSKEDDTKDIGDPQYPHLVPFAP